VNNWPDSRSSRKTSIHQAKQQGLGFLFGGKHFLQIRLGSFQPGLFDLLRRLEFGNQVSQFDDILQLHKNSAAVVCGLFWRLVFKTELRDSIFDLSNALRPNREFALRHCD
jgi:hypothetical protein